MGLEIWRSRGLFWSAGNFSVPRGPTFIWQFGKWRKKGKEKWGNKKRGEMARKWKERGNRERSEKLHKGRYTNTEKKQNEREMGEIKQRAIKLKMQLK